MSVGDVNSKEKGSGARYNEGKPDYSLIPLCTMEDEAKVWAYGKRKYAAWNWCKGMDWDVPFACMMRHMSKWQQGEENDPESGLPHLAHAMCNLRMLTLFAKTYPEGDHRPKQWIGEYASQPVDKETAAVKVTGPTFPALSESVLGQRPSISARALDSPHPVVLTNSTPETHGWTATNATNKVK